METSATQPESQEDVPAKIGKYVIINKIGKSINPTPHPTNVPSVATNKPIIGNNMR